MIEHDEPDSTFELRLRNLWGEYLLVVGLVGLLAMGAGAWAVADVVADDSPATEERTIQVMEATGSFEDGATVQRDSPAFSSGERLTDRSLYYTSITPVLDGTHRVSYDATGDGSLDVETRATLVVRETDEDVVYWEITEPLGSEAAGSLAPGETVETDFSVNVTEDVDRRAASAREDLGASPGSIDARVAVRTSLEGSIDGERVSRTMVSRLGIDSDGTTYRVDGEGGSVSQERVETVTLAPTGPPLELYGGVALVLFGTGIVGLTVVGRTRGLLELTQAEEHALVREAFDEWITDARLPAGATDRETIPVSSLQGLVDLAIDTDGRVVFDETTGRYVLDGHTYRYVFDPGHRPEADAPDSTLGGAGSTATSADGDARASTSSGGDRPSKAVVGDRDLFRPRDGDSAGGRADATSGGRWAEVEARLTGNGNPRSGTRGPSGGGSDDVRSADGDRDGRDGTDGDEDTGRGTDVDGGDGGSGISR